MTATANYQAGVEANQTVLSYQNEVTWGTLPAATPKWNSIRYLSDTLALTKTRQRPSEINITREVSQGVTTTQIAGGTINYALSWGTYDDFFGSLCQGEWSTPVRAFSFANDITLSSNGTATLHMTSTLAGKFAGLAVGQYVRLSGFANATYNSWFKVSVYTSDADVSLLNTVAVATNTETSVLTGQVQVAGSRLNNGVTFHSLTMQRKFDGKGFIRWGGCYVTRITLGAAVGSFFTGAIDVVARQEGFAASDASTGGPNLAPGGSVIDPVAGYVKMTYAGTTNTIAANLDQLQITLENTGAAPEFALGAGTATTGGVAGASGILGGTFTGSGTFRMYCKDFLLYNIFQSEAPGDVQFYLQDALKQSYILSFQNVNFMAKINATGPGAALMVDVTFECNPDPVATGTFQMDRFPQPS
jgi:hypothetical protein